MKKKLAILTAAGLSFNFLTPLVSYADNQKDGDLKKSYNINEEQNTEDLKTILKKLSDENKIKNKADEYELVKKEKDNLGFTHYTLKPKANGYLAQLSEIKIHTDKSGKVVYVNGDLDQGKLEVKNEVKIDKEKAIDLAFNSIGKSRSEVKNVPDKDILGEVKVVVDEEINKAVYSIEIMYISPEANHWKISVDAENGEIVKKQSLMEKVGPIRGTKVDGKGIGVLGQERPLNVTKSVDRRGKAIFYLSDTTRREQADVGDKHLIETRDYNDAISGKLNSTVSSSTNIFKDAAAIDAHYFANEVYNYYKNVHNRDSYDGNGAAIYSYVHNNSYNNDNGANAYWNGSAMIYGDGGGYFKPLSAAKDVIAHELTHAVTGSTAGLEYRGQSGALNESFSDVFGYFVDHEDWEMGEDLDVGGVPGRALRSLKNPELYGDPANLKDFKISIIGKNQNDKNDQDCGGVHTNSGIPNKAAYNTIMNLGEGKTEKEKANTGRVKAEQIYYRALTKYLHPKTQFAEAKLDLMQAAKDLYGEKEAKAVEEAWNSVGVETKNPEQCAEVVDLIELHAVK